MTTNDTPYKYLGKLLCAKRKERHLTQKELGLRLSIERSAISKIENGDYNLSLLRIINYCKEIDIPLSSVIKELEEVLSSSNGSQDHLANNQ